MLPKCKAAVLEAAKAAGRKAPTKAQLEDIESRLSAAKTQLAREDIATWRSMTGQQKVMAAAARAMEDIKAEAAKKLEQAELQIQRTAEVETRIQAMQEARGERGRVDALSRDAMITDRMATFERKSAMGRLMSLIEAATSKEGATLGRKALMTLFDAENPKMTGDIVREIFKAADGSSGNAMAQKAARAWLDTIEELRTRFNAAGGDVGKLDYGYTPQPHDTARIRKATKDVWVQKIAPMLDRSRYLYEDGMRMSDDDLKEMLGKVYDTLSSDGVNKMEPGKFTGSGKRANRGSDTRQIHFADGDAWVNYMREFGRGTIYDAMMGHVAKMTRDITLVERYGPDMQSQVRLQLDMARKADEIPGSQPLTNWHTVDPETYFKIISGEVGMPKSEALARTGAMVRNFQTAAKLGSAIVSSVTDLGTLAITAGYNKLGYWQLFKNIGNSATPEWMASLGIKNGKHFQEFMASHMMISDSVADNLNRWSGDHIGVDWSGKMSNAVMRFSLMNAWTNGLREGFSMSMGAAVARMAKTAWAQLDEFDRMRLSQAGITEADWLVVQNSATAVYKGQEVVSAAHIADKTVAAKVFGFINDEAEFAVINPDLTTRAAMTWGGQQAGTLNGELMRTFMQFKSFPAAMVTRHWRRIAEMDKLDGAPAVANRYNYALALFLTTTALGAIATQAKQVLAGKDPIDMTPDDSTGMRFWGKAAMQGGGLSIIGDLFLTDQQTSFGDEASAFAKGALGPTYGSIADLSLRIGKGNIWEAAMGKDTHWEAELANWAKSNTPGASLWWIKPMLDRGVMDQFNEAMSPGYLAKMKARARKDWGQNWWWTPGQTSPDRAPDLSAVNR